MPIHWCWATHIATCIMNLGVDACNAAYFDVYRGLYTYIGVYKNFKKYQSKVHCKVFTNNEYKVFKNK